MTISRISANLQHDDLPSFGAFRNVQPVFDKFGYPLGIVLEEGEFQWVYLPVGSEVWYDDESDIIVTKQPEPFAIKRVSEMREDVGVLLP